MPGKKRVEPSDDLGQIRTMLEQMRSESRLTAEAVGDLGRQHSLELRELESRVNGRFDILEAVAHSHAAELRGLKRDVTGLKADFATIKGDTTSIKPN